MSIQNDYKEHMRPTPNRAALTVPLVCLLLLPACVTVQEGMPDISGTNVLQTVAVISGFGKDAEVERNNSVTLMAPFVTFTRPDGTVISASNATVTLTDYKRIGGKSTIPSGINAGANLIGAGAELAGTGRP